MGGSARRACVKAVGVCSKGGRQENQVWLLAAKNGDLVRKDRLFVGCPTERQGCSRTSLAGLLEQPLRSGQSCTLRLAPLGVWCWLVTGVGEVVPARAELVNLKGEFLCRVSARQPASSSDSAGVSAMDVGH